MKKLKKPLKITLIVSIILNVLLSAVFLYQYTHHKNNYGIGDTNSYRIFIHRLEYFSQTMGEVVETNGKVENMNLLINADERLNLSIHSFIRFENSMASTKMNSHSIELFLSYIDEAMFERMSAFNLEDYDISTFEDLKNRTDELLRLLPDAYNPQDQKRFIETINDIIL
ncbi:hypothetical protein ABER99_22515 [Paenibacillus glucanolyticus]|jgi:hypothetical protein|uniref:hypothetical protein n=1 Tax=Paenibacillus glucanolyticus TaxID=59843 RepID=UPI0003E20889|nr:hypothetical protein [Paenibacillus glucanolyticus]ETT30425.1 hypothetical protein C169_28750 [Paenibacillus sp. FSL R5-808]